MEGGRGVPAPSPLSFLWRSDGGRREAIYRIPRLERCKDILPHDMAIRRTDSAVTACNLGRRRKMVIDWCRDLPIDNLQAGRCAFVILVMSCFWVVEVVPLPVIALLPLVALPLLSVLSVKTVAASYLNVGLIYLIYSFLIPDSS